MMNENIEEASTVQELKKQKDNILAEMDNLVQKINKLFEEQRYKEIVLELTKVRFCKRALESIEKKEQEMIQ